MNKIRNSALRFQLGFVVLLLACRVVASVVDGSQAAAFQADHAIEMRHAATGP